MSVIGNTALAFSEEQSMIMDVAREFCRDKSPISAVREQLDSALGFDAGIWQQMASLGWPGIALPEAYGGSGLGVAGLVPVVEAMGRGMLGTPFIATSLAAQALLRCADEQQKERWLPQLAAGTVATLAVLESGDWGSEALNTALDSSMCLQGVKQFVADAQAADVFLVAVTHENQPALAIVAKDKLPAGAIKANTLIDQTKRCAEVDFTGVELTKEELIASADVSAALRDVKLLGALLVASEAVGSTAACLDTIVEYLKTRKQFGKLIGSYQALKHPTVDILTALDAGRSFIYHAATLVSDAPLCKDAEVACRMAKAQAAEALLFAGDRAVQFHGGMGFTYECDAQLYIRRAQWSQQQYGDAQHHRKRLAALLLD